MKVLPSPFVATLALSSALNSPAFAQNAALDLPKIFAVGQTPRAQVKISLAEIGVSSRATLQLAAPSNARFEISGDETVGAPPRTVVASGAQTIAIDGASKRARLWNWNVLAQPWRSQNIDAGGPANFWLGALDVAALQKAYAIGASVKGETRTLELKARPEIGRFLVRDEIRSGGKGNGKFYAARKRVVWDRPTRIVLGLDAKTFAPRSRREFDGTNRLISTTSFATDAQNRVQNATTRDFHNRIVARWRYDWSETAADFAADAFSIAAPAGQILEEAMPQPSAPTDGPADASLVWNDGMRAARLENVNRAFAAWQEAARLAPQAVAPPMARFDLALQVRDANQAADALRDLSALLGENNLEVLSRRVALANLRRDSPSIKAALDAAVAAHPKNLALKLRRASYERAFGDAILAAREVASIVGDAKSPAPFAVEAAALLAAWNAQAEITAIADNGANKWRALAALLLQIENGTPPDENALQSTADGIGNDRARAAIANSLEKAGRFEDAIAQWTKIAATATEPLWLEARRHLMLLSATKGSTLESLRAYRDIVARSDGEGNLRALQDALFSAWDKALGREKLRIALQSRAISTAATTDDARLWLAWLENYGSGEEIVAHINVSASRWPRAAWWQSRKAEVLVDQAQNQPISDVSGAGRTRVYNEALKTAAKAVELDAAQPFYAMQRSLIATRRATEKIGVLTAGTRVKEINLAVQGLTSLRSRWPDDIDARLSLAVQQLALAEGKDVDVPLQTLQSILADESALSSVESDLHPTLFTARLTLAATLRRAGRAPAASEQYGNLLSLARTPAEYSGVVLNSLNFLDSQRDAIAVAALMQRIVGEAWPFGDTQELMSQWVGALARRRELLAATRESLAESKTPAARLSAAYLDFAFLRLAQSAAAGDDAPIPAQAALRDATAKWKITLADLQRLAQDKNATIAAQAAALSAQDALSRGDSAGAGTFFARALSFAPSDLDLRLGVVRALADDKQTASILALRDGALATLSTSPSTLRWAAWMSLRGGDKSGALRLARAAFNLATASGADATTWRDSAFIFAHALSANEDFAGADRIYEQLSDKQWSFFQRASALLDWQERADATGREAIKSEAAKRLAELKLDARNLRRAQNFVRGLD